MAESKKTELEIHREMMTLLSHLMEKKTRVRKKVPMAQTSKQEIKADVRKILEQFLKKQQLNDDEEEGAIPTGFQREDVENVTETYRSGSTNTSWEEYECLRCEAGCRSKVIKSIPTCSNRSPTDDTTNFTFIDEYEHDVERSDKDHSERSNSPPFSDKIPVYGAGPPQRLQSGTESETDNTDYDEVISPHEDAEKIAEGRARPATGLQGIRVCEAGAPERLQSGTESETDDTDYDKVISPNEDAEKIAEGRARPAMWLQGIRVCEAGAPERLQSGTESETDDTDYNEVISPNEDAEKIAEGRARPAIGRQRLVSGTESDTDDTDFGKEFISLKEDIEWIRVGTVRGLQRLMSETEPKTDDTDYEEEVISRKKDIERREVGAAKPAIGRQRLMSGTESDTDDNDHRSVIIKRWKSRKKKDIDSSVNKRGDVVQNVHTHKISHVEQHNYTNGNKSGMLMESEVWECKDLAGKSVHKHGERHSNIRETMRPRHATSGRTSSEKDRLYSAVAEKLAHIGDHYRTTSPLSDSTRSSMDHTATRRASARTPNLPGVDKIGNDGLTALERQLIDTLREVGDTYSFQLKLSPNAIKEIVKQAMYQRFQEVVEKKTGPGNSWDQIAAVFYLTKKVVTLAGVGGAIALQVKDLAAEYVADKFATWIVDQGGWDTFLDSDSDLDIE